MMQDTDMASDRQIQFKIMLSTDEKLWLEALAKARGLTASDVLRQYIREAHAGLAAARGDVPAALRSALSAQLQSRGMSESAAKRAVDEFAKGGELPVSKKSRR